MSKKAIVIGASSGIGAALAKNLADNGYKVGITGRREENLKLIKASNPDAFLVKSFDCTEMKNSEYLEEMVEELGSLDLLILSSGTGDLNEDLNFDIENRTNQLNVIAFTQIVTWVMKYFEQQEKGHLVAISSIGGMRGSRAAPAYNASKAYQINYLEGMRQRVKKSGKPIYVTDIRPGFVDTDMAKGEGQFWVASKEKAAKQIFDLIKRRKDIGYVTKRWRLIAFILRLLPNALYKRH
jgi:short-subunit dehydrogenase